MSFKLLDRLKRNKSKTDYENVICANCKTQFSGHFCSNCGQAVKEYDKPFSFVFYNFLGDFFAFDTRFFRTIGALLFKPGYLSKEYIEGRRVRYAPPFRIFVFVSFVLFLMLQTYTNRGLTTVLDADINNGAHRLDSVLTSNTDSLAKAVVMDLNPNDLAATESLLNKYGVAVDTTENDSVLHFSANLETFRDTRDLRDGLNKYATVLEQKLEKEQDTEERLVIMEHIRLCRSPEQALAKVLKYISWAFFLLLPIFALILKLVYIRRKRNYMRHLIFSIHIHAFIYVVMIAIVGSYMTFTGNIEAIISLLVLVIPTYMIIAIKKFYGQTIGKAIAKFFAVSFLYNIIFVFVVLGAIANALNLI